MIKKGLIRHEFIEKELLLDLEWDSRPPIETNNYRQRDWNRTLITKITMISNTIHKNTYQGGADTIRLGSEIWMMVLPEYTMLQNYDEYDETGKVGNLCGRWEVYLDENVPYNEILVCREQTTYGVTLENTEGDTPTMRFNYNDMFDKKKLRGRIRINE